MIGNLYWAQMPMSIDKLTKIECSHRVRPYLIFAQKDEDTYYAFAATSKLPNGMELENSYVVCGNSKIKLDECVIISKKNIIEHNSYSEYDDEIECYDNLGARRYSELIKKLKINLLFDSNMYPKEVADIVSKLYEMEVFNNKDILYNGENFIVIEGYTSLGYKVHDISYYAKEGYIEFIHNGNKCYLNPNGYYINDINDYEIYGVSSELSKLFNQKLSSLPKTLHTDDTSNICSLPIGSVISWFYEEEEYILIKIAQDDNTITFLVGRKGSYKRDYVPYVVNIDCDLDYEFYNVLSSDKLKLSMTKASIY